MLFALVSESPSVIMAKADSVGSSRALIISQEEPLLVFGTSRAGLKTRMRCRCLAAVWIHGTLTVESSVVAVVAGLPGSFPLTNRRVTGSFGNIWLLGKSPGSIFTMRASRV